MTEVPKIVYDRLRAALPNQAVTEGPHPDPDLLTAFAEQALSATEREVVLEHLARCGNCRELIALALPAADAEAAPVAAVAEADRATVSRAGAPVPRKLRFAWPSLRWAALAAGAVVAAALLLVHPGKLNQGALPSANRTAVPVGSGPQIAASPAASSSVATPSADKLAVLAKTEEPQSKAELRPSKKINAGQRALPPHLEEREMLADSRKDSGEAGTQPAAPPAERFAINAPTRRAATETVEVTGAAVGGQVAPSTESNLVARNETTAIEKAKPATQEIGANEQKAPVPVVPGPARLQARNMMSAVKLAPAASPALAHNLTWTITEGVLQRSANGGQSWQTVLHADHPLQCYASYNQEIWTGGPAGSLFHSADSGTTWLQVQPSINAQALTSDITHIDVRGPAEVVISTSNHEIWSSADNGKTWQKK